MKTIIAGSRGIDNYDVVCSAIANSEYEITEVVSGTARGVDKLGEMYAKLHNIPIKQFPANWNELGKRAGYIRNEEMAQYAEAAVICWDCVSKGTRHMIRLCQKYNIKYFIDF